MLVAGNWKMYKTASETAEFCRELRDTLGEVEGVDVAVCPPFTGLAPAVQALADTEIAVAAQNVHWEREGANAHGGQSSAFTGASFLANVAVADNDLPGAERRLAVLREMADTRHVAQ